MRAVKTVKFKFGWGGSGSHSNREAAVKAGMKAFTLPDGALYDLWDGSGYIICRADQFAEFLIYRQEQNGQNNFAALEVTILPEGGPPTIDVSKKY